MAIRGFSMCHQTIQNWTETFGIDVSLKLRKRRYAKTSSKIQVDATYIKVEGRWCYLYRAIDSKGHLVDVYLSDTRDTKAAEKFFEQMVTTTGINPKQITTDREPAFRAAIHNIFQQTVKQKRAKYMNNIIEQSHRGIKSRARGMKGFKNPFSALIKCTTFEEIQQKLNPKRVIRAKRRRIVASNFQDLNNLLKIAA